MDNGIHPTPVDTLSRCRVFCAVEYAGSLEYRAGLSGLCLVQCLKKMFQVRAALNVALRVFRLVSSGTPSPPLR